MQVMEKVIHTNLTKIKSTKEVTMFNRLLTSHRFSGSSFKMKVAAMLFVFASALIFTACNQQPEPGIKASNTTESSQGQSLQVSQSPQLSTALGTAIEQVADKAMPAVVHIEVKEHQEMANPFYAYKDNPFFRRFFGLPKKMPKKLQRELIGIGTGVIIDAQGHILSNYHVVGGASKIVVTLSDGTQYPATVVGVDPQTDLGVIKINADHPLPFLTFANSDDVKVGQWVVAIGEPRDAAINPGNSGGPLLALDDRVVGINSMIASESGGFEGIGFAIPSNMAAHVAKALIAHGKVERGWVGVGAQDLTADLAKSFGLAAPKGALIAQVEKGGPADKAGLKKGDVVISYQDRQVADASDFRNDVANSAIGQQVKIGIWRDDKKEEIPLTIGNLDVERKTIAAEVKSRMGVVVRPLTIKEAEDYGLSLPEGVAIQWVDPKGPFGKAGFEVGDVIVGLDDHPVQGVDIFDELMTAMPHHQKVVLLAINHKTGQSAYVQVETS